jgi:hypothetical protein
VEKWDNSTHLSQSNAAPLPATLERRRSLAVTPRNTAGQCPRDVEGLIRIVRLDTFEVVARFPAHSGRVSGLDLDSDSRILLSVGQMAPFGSGTWTISKKCPSDKGI